MAIAFTNVISYLVFDPVKQEIISPTSLSLSSIIVSIIVITTLIRFYHGNVRHLSEDYLRERIIEERRSGIELAIDFFFIMAQSIIFVFMSFYIGTRFQFKYVYDLVLILFGADILWFILLALARKTLSWKYPEARWTAVNILTLIILLLMRDHMISIWDPELAAKAFGGIMLGNMVLDYSINWPFYFPRPFRRELVIFFAAPFTNRLVEDPTAKTGKCIEPEYQQFLQMIFNRLRQEGYEVRNAFEAEDWGREQIPSEAMTIRDYNDVLSSDVLVVYLDGTETEGVYLELGWASAFKRYILIVYPESFKENFEKSISPIIRGLRTLARDYKELVYKDVEDLIYRLISELNEVKIHGTFL